MDSISQSSPRTGFWLLLSLLALLAAGKVILGDTLDPDAFWHMRVGEEIARQSWPHTLVDDLSFASIRTPWTPYSWLAELGMKGLWDVGGFQAAVAVQAAMESAFIILLGLGALELSTTLHGQPRYLASAIGAAFGGVLSLAYLSFRPVTAALVLLALVGWLLLRDRRLNQKSKAVWMIPLITAILINIHFFAFFAPIWIAALVLGDFIESRRIAVRGPVLLVSTLVACLCTPLLSGTLRSIFDYSTSDIMVHSSTIAEFRPFYSGVMGNIAAAFVAITSLCILWHLVRPPKIRLGEVFWFTLSVILLLRMGRMAPIFAIIAVPTFAATIPNLSDAILSRRPILAALTIVLALTIYPIAHAFPRTNDSLETWLNRNGPDAPHYPCKAADYVEQNIPAQTHHLLCDFTWGGFLEWRLGNQYQTLMDGRTQLFSGEFWKSAALDSPSQRQRFLASLPADAAIVRAGSSPLRTDLAALNWKNVYRDDFAEVWIPPLAKPEIPNPNNESITKSE
jgi:hypothetical protein